METVGKQVMEGSGVSLTRLLRSCQLSLIQFFSKARSWADMNNLQRTLVDKIDKLERNFAVSNVIFKKYQPIFVDLFKDPSQDPPRLKTSRLVILFNLKNSTGTGCLWLCSTGTKIWIKITAAFLKL